MTTEAFGAIEQKPAGIPRARPFVALGAILHREALRFLGQRGRLIPNQSRRREGAPFASREGGFSFFTSRPGS